MNYLYKYINKLSVAVRELERIKSLKNLKRKGKEDLLFNDLNNVLLDLYTAWSDQLIVSLQRQYPKLSILKDRRKYPDKRVFFTFPLDKIKKGKQVRKKDIPAVCIGIDASTIAEDNSDASIIIEDDKTTLTLLLKGLSEYEIKMLIGDFALFFSKPSNHTLKNLDKKLISYLAKALNVKSVLKFKKTLLPKFSCYDEKSPINRDNPRDLKWFINKFKKHQNIRVAKKQEEVLKFKLGGQEVEFLRSGDMYFVMNNMPTIKIMDLAIKEGILSKRDKKGFISIEREVAMIGETHEEYQKKGSMVGKQKDYRKDNFWANAKAEFEYDPTRGLYYLEMGGEPVMDEFEKDFISLLGQNAARYGGAILEVGFGMGISANAIQKELYKHILRGDNCIHIIIELNKEIARLARKWARRQKVPTVILEGDWKNVVKKIPNDILAGALADPYPLDVSEKHEDAARTLKELYRCLRPGGVVTYYSDSQYALSKRHIILAKLAGFKYVGNITSSFGGELNTGEYYKRGLRMAIPSLYKDSGKSPFEKIKKRLLTDNEKKKIIKNLFIEEPARFRDYYNITGY